jgi:hypothetical protein
VELHELHVLQRQAGAQHHAAAVAGAGVGRGAGEIGAAIAAGRQHVVWRGSGGCAVIHAQRDRRRVQRAIVHDEVDGEIFDVESRTSACWYSA